VLVAVAAGNLAGSAAFIFYLVAYTLTTLAAFALLAVKGRGGESDVLIDDLSGLAADRPWLAFALAVCMLSLLGFPGTAGFMGKWYILVAATQNAHWWLAALLVLTSVVSAGYYLPVIMVMYMKPSPSAAAHADARLGRPQCGSPPPSSDSTTSAAPSVTSSRRSWRTPSARASPRWAAAGWIRRHASPWAGITAPPAPRSRPRCAAAS